MYNDAMQKFIILLGLVVLLAACKAAPQGQFVTTPLPTTRLMSTLPPTRTATHTPAPSATATQPLTPTPLPAFSFVITSDMTNSGGAGALDGYPQFFRGICEQIVATSFTDFMLSAGDIHPADDTFWTIQQVFGENYHWFPAFGNHDLIPHDFKWMTAYFANPAYAIQQHLVNGGPATCPDTTYSFDYQNAHFVMLNVYCDENSAWGIDGSISDVLYDWLAADLAATQQTHIFVVGHEPAFPQTDAETGIVRHYGESLDQYPAARDRFWQLLQTQHVLAYVHGHTHGYSITNYGGVWQVDAGHAYIMGAAPSPGTFILMHILGDQVRFETYRGKPGHTMQLFEQGSLR